MHVHSQNSHDSTAPVRDTAMACIEKGIFAFAVTDHCDIQYYKEQDAYSRIRNSAEEARATAKELGNKVKILTGIELGEGIWHAAHTAAILSAFDYDVVIGSVHAVRYKTYTDPYSAIDFSPVSSEDLDAYMATYFDEVLETVRQIPCDIMAHLTCPLRYINGKYGRGVDVRRYADKIERILAYVIEHSIAMEVNTSGIGTSFGSFMPEEWIIRLYREMGGYLLTLGSDAHVPENAGKGFADAISLLKKFGYEAYYWYQNRTAIPIDL